MPTEICQDGNSITAVTLAGPPSEIHPSAQNVREGTGEAAAIIQRRRHDCRCDFISDRLFLLHLMSSPRGNARVSGMKAQCKSREPYISRDAGFHGNQRGRSRRSAPIFDSIIVISRKGNVPLRVLEIHYYNYM